MFLVLIKTVELVSSVIQRASNNLACSRSHVYADYIADLHFHAGAELVMNLIIHIKKMK